ncbi:MAG TPA: sigma-54 dependent transcriptional regulator [Candidatus Sulfotelmatobacter sp.]|nr:sigma-54 dependent transcriptional regulator [Candidatus Sulfotelmatobacter sp.]
MSYPPIVLVHSNDPSYRPLQVEAEPINAVLAALGGKSIPLCVTAGMRAAPAVAIIHAAHWPQWPEALRTLKAMWHETPLVGILEWETIGAQSLQSIISGELNDFLCAPVREAELRARIDRLLYLAPKRAPQPEIQAFKVRHRLESLLGSSEVFARALHRIPLLAAVDATVLITGETGTGKELVARALHYCGHRRDGPFVPCNCGALPDHLLENELFGHAPGAYTDARTEQKGLLAIAGGGTLFLDEIESLSLSGQVKLLRLLQDREYRPLGSAQTCRADVRIMAATNVELVKLVTQKLFREDLFHRLNVLQINLPPLRERIGDVEGLAQTFLRRFSAQMNRPVLKLSAEAFRALESYDWPGNVRELESVIQRATVLTSGSIIEPSDLELPRDHDRPVAAVTFEIAKRHAIHGFERGYLIQLLSQSEGNISHAARQAGKDRRSFQRLLRKYGLTALHYRH